jgi:hypothetical protein
MGGGAALVRLSWPELSWPGGPGQDDWVLMLERRDGQWQVVAPLQPDELVRVGELPLVDGQRQLELSVSEGAERAGAVLVPARHLPDWRQPDWEALLEAMESEGWPAGTVRLDR